MGSRNESKAEKDRQKQIQDKCQNLLNEMLRDEDNKYCVDCDAKGPRWAAWNLGVFLCIRCAGIHRNLGVHISKVRSVNLDTWTPEQVISLQQMGNSRARAVYEATLPETYRRPQTDSLLESFIRAKYQHKKYIAKEWVPPPLPKPDWDKEMDEEAERQRRKKKEKQAQSSLPPIKKLPITVKVPPLPKPTSSPKSSRTSSTSAEGSKQASSSVDLLGLNASVTATSNGSGNGDDVFSSFLSAPAAQPSAEPLPATVAVAVAVAPLTDPLDAKGRSAEEESFFSQSAPNSEPKKPLSKDSILALYSSQTGAPAQPSMFPAQAGLFPANPSMAFAAPTAAPGMFPVANSGGFPVPNHGGFPAAGAGGFPMAGPFVNSLGGQQAPVSAAAPQANPNPFFGMSFGMVPPQRFPVQNSLVQHGSNTSKPSDDLLSDFGAPAPNLSQPMAGLNLGQPVAATGQPTFSAMPGTGFPGMAPNFVNPPVQPSLGQTFTTHLWQ